MPQERCCRTTFECGKSPTLVQIKGAETVLIKTTLIQNKFKDDTSPLGAPSGEPAGRAFAQISLIKMLVSPPLTFGVTCKEVTGYNTQ